MSQYVDRETGEIIDAVQFRREQARIVSRQKDSRFRRRVHDVVNDLLLLLLVVGITLAVIHTTHVSAMHL